MGGMQYLWENSEETGTLGLRFLQNVDENDKMIKETCGAGFFRNWADLEVWSSTHPSHLAIFVGALAHGRCLSTWSIRRAMWQLDTLANLESLQRSTAVWTRQEIHDLA